MEDAEFERYSRHINLAQIGFDGQLALGQARALIIGAGGLGCPAALYLAGAGVGHLTLVDDDQVELSNLQRQIAHTSDRIGSLKSDSLRRACLALNPGIAVDSISQRASAETLDDLVHSTDVVLDASDNLETRHAVNRACAILGKTLVTASAIRFEGQIAVFRPGIDASACYRCLYPDSLGDQENCQSAGVVGPLVGVLGSYMALEAIKQVIGEGRESVSTLWLFDALANHWQAVAVSRKANCPVCGQA
ncbi:MAG: molybdopterin-synthase adenylyltransferase MoeB [Pseudomonadota bacterium]